MFGTLLPAFRNPDSGRPNFLLYFFEMLGVSVHALTRAGLPAVYGRRDRTVTAVRTSTRNLLARLDVLWFVKCNGGQSSQLHWMSSRCQAGGEACSSECSCFFESLTPLTSDFSSLVSAVPACHHVPAEQHLDTYVSSGSGVSVGAARQ